MSATNSPVSPPLSLGGSSMTTAYPFSGIPSSPTLSELGAETIIFESYLQKTPPLKSFIMKWTKRWFVLSRQDPMDPTNVQLSYYKDSNKKEVRSTIDLSKFVGIRPSAKVGNHENVFAIETEERKYILKAHDIHTKNIWLAKLCEIFGQEQVCHVTIPQQCSCPYTEAILKLTSPAHVTAVTPSTGSTLLEIPFDEIRRLGSVDMFGTNIIWFETCKNSVADNFYFLTLSSGREIAQQVVRDFKTAIECYTSMLLIMESSTDSEISFISRDHYGCPQFPALSRSTILQTGLRQLSATWQTFVMHERIRRESESSMHSLSDHGASGSVSLDEWVVAKGKRKASSMKVLSRRPTLDKFVRQTSTPSSDRDRSSPLPELSAGHFSDSCDVFDPPIPHTITPSHSTHSSPRQRKSLLSHQSSSSSLTTSTPSPNPPRQRKLSYQSSVSSHCSTGSLPRHKERESSSPSVTSLDSVDAQIEPTFAYIDNEGRNAPAVPPRSMVSLQDSYIYSRHLATAH